MKRMVDEEIINQAKKATIAVVVSNIKQISDEILSSLKAGDIVQKEDSTGKHSYVVSFKKDGTGMCLTYTDASVVETQSYDFTDGHWVYNSEDKMPLVNVEDAPSGEIADALGLDAQGKLVKGQASAGSKLYYHDIEIRVQGSPLPMGRFHCYAYLPFNTAITKDNLYELMQFAGKNFTLPLVPDKYDNNTGYKLYAGTELFFTGKLKISKLLIKFNSSSSSRVQIYIEYTDDNNAIQSTTIDYTSSYFNQVTDTIVEL